MSSDGAPQLLSDIKAVPFKHKEVTAVAAGSDDTAAGPIKKTSGVRCVGHMLSTCCDCGERKLRVPFVAQHAELQLDHSLRLEEKS